MLCKTTALISKVSIHSDTLFETHSENKKNHQEMRYPNVTSLYFATPLAFNAPDGGVSLGRSP